MTDIRAMSLHALGQGQSVLGERTARIPIGGKIRAGIKVLKSAAQSNKQAVEIYQRGVEAGAAWSAIEKRIQQDCKFNKAALVPKNVEYFSVRRADFTVHEIADRIIDLYGEDRGEGQHLYRFPVIFPLDNWQANMPHGLKAFTASELKFWSEYGSDGTRYCKTRGTVEVDQKARRAKRVFGGRPEVIRGPCSPNECHEYQAGQCKLSGSLVFFIPSIPGSSAIELPSTSFYSMQQWRQQMELVSFLRGGRISGLLNGKPIFWLTKRMEAVSMIDPESGKAVRKKQWIVHLEADIPMDTVFAEHDQNALLAGSQAVAMLENSPLCAGYTVPLASAEWPAPVAQQEPEQSETRAIPEKLARILTEIGIDHALFTKYAVNRWGDDWDEDGATGYVQQAIAENDIGGLIDKIHNPPPEAV